MYLHFTKIEIVYIRTIINITKQQIFGMRVLERLRGINTDVIQGVERVYFYDQSNLDLNQKPITVIKSKFTLKKIS